MPIARPMRPSRAGETITPAAQWLLDNQLPDRRTSSRPAATSPRRFIRQLPLYKVPLEQYEGMPRIFALAWLYVAHTDSNFR